MMKAADATGNNNKTCKSETKYSANKDKYSSKVSAAGCNRDKYASATKYSVKNGATSETTKYSAQEKYSTGASAHERRASYKSVERWDNERNAAREQEGKGKSSPWGKGKDDAKVKSSPWGKDKDDAKARSSFSSSTKSETKRSWLAGSDATKDKYKSSSSGEGRWCTKNLASSDSARRTFSSQTAASSWEEKNRGRAFPYDREHELRRSMNKYDADAKNLDPKYRKAAMATGIVAAAAVGPLDKARVATGAGGQVGVRDDPLHGQHAAATARPTGCHNCALQ